MQSQVKLLRPTYSHCLCSSPAQPLLHSPISVSGVPSVMLYREIWHGTFSIVLGRYCPILAFVHSLPRLVACASSPFISLMDVNRPIQYRRTQWRTLLALFVLWMVTRPYAHLLTSPLLTCCIYQRHYHPVAIRARSLSESRTFRDFRTVLHCARAH